MCGAPCGCGKNIRMSSALFVGLILSLILSLLLCLFASISFLAGGHGYTLICSTLYDSRYKTLAHLLDDGSILYKNGGFLKNFLRGNESLKTENVLRLVFMEERIFSIR